MIMLNKLLPLMNIDRVFACKFFFQSLYLAKGIILFQIKCHQMIFLSYFVYCFREIIIKDLQLNFMEFKLNLLEVINLL